MASIIVISWDERLGRILIFCCSDVDMMYLRPDDHDNETPCFDRLLECKHLCRC